MTKAKVIENDSTPAYDKTPVFRSRENEEGNYEVFRIADGLVISTWESRFLARQRVSVLNRSILSARCSDAFRLETFRLTGK